MKRPIYGLVGHASLAPLKFNLPEVIRLEKYRIKFGFVQSIQLSQSSPTSFSTPDESDEVGYFRQGGEWPIVLEQCALRALLNCKTEDQQIDCIGSFQHFQDGSRRVIVRLDNRLTKGNKQ